MSYKDTLKNGESLNDLCDRIKQKPLEYLVEDIILERYDNLISYGYLQNRRLSSVNEQAYEWLSKMPNYVRKDCRSIFDKLFTQAIEDKDWNTLNTLLMITNSGNGVSEKLLEKFSHKNIPETIIIDIHLTLLNKHREKGLSPDDVLFWDNRISIDDTPYLAVILMSLVAKYDPLKLLEYFRQLDKMDMNIPKKPEIRLSFLEQLREGTLNYINYYNSNLADKELRYSKYMEWGDSINSLWIRELIHDTLSLRKLTDIRKAILEVDNNFLKNLRKIPSAKPIPEVDTTTPVMKPISEVQAEVEEKYNEYMSEKTKYKKELQD